MKKQMKIKKLELKKETVANLQQVTGGSNVYNTVYIYVESDACSTDCPVVYT